MSTIVSKLGCASVKSNSVLSILLGLCCYFGYSQPSQAASPMQARPTISFSATQLFSRGDYGLDVDTEMHATIFKARYSTHQWGASISIPYLDITGPATGIYEDFDTGELFILTIDDDNRKGIGDTVVSLDRVIAHNNREGAKFRLGASIKLPTGDEYKRLGSGELDFSLFAKGRLRRRNSVFNAQVGYQVMGDTEYTNYRNRIFITAGLFHHLERRLGVGASWRFKQASLEGGEDQKSISAFASRKLNKSWNAAFRLNRGLTDAVAKFSAGIQLSYSHRY